MSEDRYVIIKNAKGASLDVPVKFTETMIKEMQDLYIRNLLRVCNALKVTKITPNSINVIDRWTHNPYVDYDDESMFYKLGKSCMDNGMQWLFIVNNGEVHEGVHRLMGLRELVAKGEYTEEELTFPALDITNDKFTHPVEIEFFKFRRDFVKVGRYGLKTRSLFYNEFTTCQRNFMSQSAMMKYIYYEWEQKYGESFPQPELIMKYDKLMEAIKCQQEEETETKKQQ